MVEDLINYDQSRKAGFPETPIPKHKQVPESQASELYLGRSPKNGFSFQYKGHTINLIGQAILIKFPDGKEMTYLAPSADHRSDENATEAELNLHVAIDNFYDFHESSTTEDKQKLRTYMGFSLENFVENMLPIDKRQEYWTELNKALGGEES